MMLTAIKSCKYLLPCGHCDKFDNLCTQYGSVGMTISGSDIKDTMTVEEFLERNKQVCNEENLELLKEWSSISSSDYSFKTPACEKCPNNPKNGGSGICNCTIPYFNGYGTTYATNTTTSNVEEKKND